MAENDTQAFANLVESYRTGINQIDGENASIDSQIGTLKLQIKGLEQTKDTNLANRESRIRKLAGIRRLLRELEDADTARIRSIEDKEFDNGH